MGVNRVLVDDRRDDVAAKIVPAVFVQRVLAEPFKKKLRPENVNPHRREAVVGLVRKFLRNDRFLREADDPVGFVHLQHAKPPGRDAGRDFQRADGQIRAAFQVGLKHFRVVHLVNVVPGQDQHVLGMLTLDRVNVLVNGVAGPLVPVFVDPLLRRHHVEELAEFALKIFLPAETHVTVQTGRFVLGEHQDAPDPAVQHVGKGKIDDPVRSGKRNGGFRPIPGEGFQPRSFPPG